MARLARIVVPDVPHHVTQRGNRRQTVFFADEDYAAYRDLVAATCASHEVRCDRLFPSSTCIAGRALAPFPRLPTFVAPRMC